MAATQIRQEINILDAVLSAASGGTATSNEIIQLDTTQYNGTISCYFEIVTDTSVSITNTVTLRRSGTTTDDATCSIPLLTTGFTRIRSASFTPPAGQTQYVVFINTSVGAITNVRSAKIIILQNCPVIISTQTQIEVGNNEASTATTFTALTSPKYWLYTSANWDGIITAFWEATLNSVSSKITVTAELQVDNGSFASWAAVGGGVSASDISSTAGVAARVRTSTAFTLTDGRHYRVVLKTSNSKSSVNIYNAKIIINQSIVKDSYVNSGDGNTSDIRGLGGASFFSQAAGQSFTAGSSYSLAGMQFQIYKSQNPTDSVSISIYSGSITGTLLGTSNPISGTSLPTGPAPIAFQLFTFPTPISITNGTKYYVQINRSGSRDDTNYYLVIGNANGIDNYSGGDRYQEASGSWSSVNPDDLDFKTLIATITLLEPQYLLLNTNSTTTGLQNYQTLWDQTEWMGVSNIYKYAVEGSGAEVAELDDINNSNTVVTNSNETITAAQQTITSALTMPATGHQIDTNYKTKVTALWGTRILAAVIVSSGSKILNINQAVNTSNIY